MIISRTPFRISFFGGGTDYPIYYREHCGMVLSTSINKYCYITCRHLPPFFDFRYRIVYSKTEHVEHISEIEHPAVRESLNFMNITGQGLEIHYDADLPARTGIGSSSSFTVGMLNALYALKGKMITKRQLALDAIHVEQDMIKENVGSQDQTIASFGGFNKIIFGGEQEILVKPIIISPKKLQYLQDHLMLFFTGFSRNASNIAEEQIKKTHNKKDELKKLMEMVENATSILNNDLDITDFGKLLHQSWMIKRSLTDKISTPQIDEIYKTALEHGAIGGKLLGAGGGGFILFFVPPEFQHKIKEKFKNLLYVPFKFDNTGSQIIYYTHDGDI